jgi:hypothetical protein
MTETNYYTITISHNKCTAALTLYRLPYKIETHPTPLPICFLISKNVYLARITIKAHRSWNTARERLWVVGISGHPAITTFEPTSL